MANILKWVQGNDVVMTVWLYEPEVDAQGHPVYDQGVLVWQTVDLDSYDEWKVRVKNGCQSITMPASAGASTGSIIMTVPATLSCGDYAIEFTGIKNEVAVRSFETMAFGIVRTNAESNVVFDIVDGEKSCDIDIKLQIQPQTVTRGMNSYDYWKLIPGNEDKTLQDYLDYLSQQSDPLVLLDVRIEDGDRIYDFSWSDLLSAVFSGNIVRLREIEDSADGNIYTYYDLIGRIGRAVMIFGDLTSHQHVTISLTQGENNFVEESEYVSYTIQEQLVSGVNIKTINDTSLLGNGNIQINVPDVTGKEDKLGIATSLPSSGALAVNTYYRLGSVASVSANLPTMSDTAHGAVIMFGATFTGASPDVTLTPPSGVNVYKQDGWSLEQNATYEVSALWNGASWILTHVKIATS